MFMKKPIQKQMPAPKPIPQKKPVQEAPVDEYTEIKQKLYDFFDRRELSDETVYFLCKDIMDDAWDSIRNVSDAEEEDFEEDDINGTMAPLSEIDESEDDTEEIMAAEQDAEDEDAEAEEQEPEESLIASTEKAKKQDAAFQNLIKRPKVALSKDSIV